MITRNRYHPIENRLVEVKAAVPREVMQQMGKPAESEAPTGGRQLDDGGASTSNYMGDLSGTGHMPGGEWYGANYGHAYGCAARHAARRPRFRFRDSMAAVGPAACSTSPEDIVRRKRSLCRC